VTLIMHNSILRYRTMLFFFPTDPTLNDIGSLPLPVVRAVKNYRRRVAVVSATLIAALLHGCLLFWYITRPAPLPFAAAAPLPMIDMVLSAPPSPAMNQPIVPPTPQAPKDTKKTDPKPLKKPKPLPQKAAVKQVKRQKEESESAPAPSSAPPAVNHDVAASPRHDTYSPASSDVSYLNNPKPVYPMVARQRHWQGLVLLRVYISDDGQVAQVFVQRSSGRDALDDSALDAVKNWRFVPAKRGEFAEASWVSVPIDFELE